MAETKYGKYIMSSYIPPKTEAPWAPPGLSGVSKGKGGRLFFLDNGTMPGAFYMECVWVMPRPALPPAKPGEKRPGTEAHTHDYDEVLAFIGTNPDDPYDLGAEVEFWIEDEMHIITRTSLVFVPAGVKHSPLVFRRVDRPVYHYTAGPGKDYF
jgi:hypothetical protein